MSIRPLPAVLSAVSAAARRAIAPVPPWGSAVKWIPTAAALVLVLGFYLLTLRDGQEAGDASVFLNHAVNIVEGRPYTHSQFQANPLAPGIGGLPAYPPGLPVVFAAVMVLFGFQVTAFKVTIVLFFVGSLALLAILASRRLQPGTTAVLTAVIGFNPYFWQTKETLVSHIPFLFWCLLTIVLLDRSYRLGDRRRMALGMGLLAGAAMVMATLTRSVGIALPAALLLYDLVRRKTWWPSARFWLPVGVLVLAVAAQYAFLPVDSTGNYMTAASGQVSGVSDLVRSLLTNAKNYAVGCVTNTLLDNGVWTVGRYLLAALVFLLAVTGYAMEGVARASVAEPFLLAFAAIILLWPFQMLSYMVPGYVLMFYYVFVGIERLGWGRAGVILALVAFSLTYLGRYRTLDFETLQQNVLSPAGIEFYRYVQDNTPDDALFVSREAADFALYAKRPTIPPMVPADYRNAYTPAEARRLVDFMHSRGVSYVVTGPAGLRLHQEVLPLIYLVEDQPEQFTPIYHNGEFGLYRLEPDSVHASGVPNGPTS